ncbi:MAG: DUF4249 domain-containing protein [Bacteroidia bacterium]|jgi:hypothetical protein|nr:DUF4249 domain-containing protein [Bacteroidia bacterium]
MSKNLIFLLLTFLLLGCEEEVVDVNFPQKVKPVVIGFLEENAEIIQVHVSRSFPYLNASQPPSDARELVDTGALVLLYSEPQVVDTLIFDPLNLLYQSAPGTLNLTAGRTYKLQVIQPSGKVIEGLTTLPAKNKITTKAELSYSENKVEVKIDIKDELPGDNFYVVSVLLIDSTNLGQLVYLKDPLTNGLVTDEFFKTGKKINFINEFAFGEFVPNKAVIIVKEVDKVYYQYHKQVFESNMDLDFLFLSEANVMFNSFNNALGAFGSVSNSTSLEINF